MGLNIGIEVSRQSEVYMCEGSNPRGTIEEIEQSFFRFLNHKFPLGGFGGGWVSLRKDYKGIEKYDFDIRMFKYGSEFQENGYKMEQMWMAMTEYIYGEFSHMEGIEMRTYWSG